MEKFTRDESCGILRHLCAIRVLHCVCTCVCGWLLHVSEVSSAWAACVLFCEWSALILCSWKRKCVRLSCCFFFVCVFVCLCVSLLTLSTVVRRLPVFVSTYVSGIHPLLGNTRARRSAVTPSGIRWLSAVPLWWTFTTQVHAFSSRGLNQAPWWGTETLQSVRDVWVFTAALQKDPLPPKKRCYTQAQTAEASFERLFIYQFVLCEQMVLIQNNFQEVVWCFYLFPGAGNLSNENYQLWHVLLLLCVNSCLILKSFWLNPKYSKKPHTS